MEATNKETEANLKLEKERLSRLIKSYDSEYRVYKLLFRGNINCKEVILEAVKFDGRLLKYASDELRKDREVVLEAVKKDERALDYACEELRNDKEVILEVVKKDGKYLQYVSE